jgi:hypothetical protein
MSGVRRDVNEICCLPGCYAAIGCFETSVRSYHFTQHNSPEDSRYQGSVHIKKLSCYLILNIFLLIVISFSSV